MTLHIQILSATFSRENFENTRYLGKFDACKDQACCFALCLDITLSPLIV